MNVDERVKEIIADQLGVPIEKVGSEVHLINDLGADSLHVVELVVAFEEEFGIEIPDCDAERLQTVSQIVSYLEYQEK
jgi:acyl carrier protein